MVCNDFLEYFFSVTFLKEGDKEREREKDCASILWFTLQMLATTETKARNQKLSINLPQRWNVPNYLNYHLLPSKM